ncbi:MAG: hypothetical protein H6838_04090 [Planctomycetes bacterium]|nr:hypothetical protein [Planctomycetota bacterium]
MTAIDPIPESTTQPWNELFEELKTRYPKVREPIVAALASLMQNPGIDADLNRIRDRAGPEAQPLSRALERPAVEQRARDLVAGQTARAATSPGSPPAHS